MDNRKEKGRIRSSMSLEHTRTKKIEDGQEKGCLRVDFTNGALAQLEDLKSLVGSNDPIDVVRYAIALMQRIKDQNNKPSSQLAPVVKND